MGNSSVDVLSVGTYRRDGEEGDRQDGGAGVQQTAGLCVPPLTSPAGGPAGGEAPLVRPSPRTRY